MVHNYFAQVWQETYVHEGEPFHCINWKKMGLLTSTATGITRKLIKGGGGGDIQTVEKISVTLLLKKVSGQFWGNAGIKLRWEWWRLNTSQNL